MSTPWLLQIRLMRNFSKLTFQKRGVGVVLQKLFHPIMSSLLLSCHNSYLYRAELKYVRVLDVFKIHYYPCKKTLSKHFLFLPNLLNCELKTM